MNKTAGGLGMLARLI